MGNEQTPIAQVYIQFDTRKTVGQIIEERPWMQVVIVGMSGRKVGCENLRRT